MLKPINKYAEALYQPPELVKITAKEIILRQQTHAEIFILVKEDYKKFLDRPWIRQFYKSMYQADLDEECFDDVFVAYTPWIIDWDVEALVKPSGVTSPIKSFEVRVPFSKIAPEAVFVDPAMIPFRFRNSGNHMIDSEFGKIKTNSPIYDIVLPHSDILEEKIRIFYAKD